MKSVRVTISVEIDGVLQPDMPLIKELSYAEAAEAAIIAAPDSNSTTFHPVAAATMPNLGFFFLTTDQAQNLKINQNTAIALNAGAVVLIMGASLAQATPPDNIEYNNPSSTTPANLGMTLAGS